VVKNEEFSVIPGCDFSFYLYSFIISFNELMRVLHQANCFLEK